VVLSSCIYFETCSLNQTNGSLKYSYNCYVDWSEYKTPSTQ